MSDTAAEQPGTLFDAALDHLQHALLLLGGNQRVDLRLLIQPRADAQGAGDRHQALQHLAIDAALDIQARTGGAHLALIEENRPGGSGGGGLWVAIVEHDHR